MKMLRDRCDFLLVAAISTLIVANLSLVFWAPTLLESPFDTTITSLTAFTNRTSSKGIIDKSDELEKSPPWISALQIPASTLASRKDMSLISNTDDIQVSMVCIVSMMRSSSSFFSHRVIAHMPCHTSLDEIFHLDSQSYLEAWGEDGVFLSLRPEPSENSASQLAQVVLRAARRKCRANLERYPRSQRLCANHCWVNWKQFDTHFNDTTKIHLHGQIWKLLQPYDLSLVVLERPVQDRWPSYWYGKQTGDWNRRGDEQHKTQLAAMAIPEMEADFRNSHLQWYSYVRSFLSANDDFHWKEYTFDQVTKTDVEQTQQTLREFFSSSRYQ